MISVLLLQGVRHTLYISFRKEIEIWPVDGVYHKYGYHVFTCKQMYSNCL